MAKKGIESAQFEQKNAKNLTFLSRFAYFSSFFCRYRQVFEQNNAFFLHFLPIPARKETRVERREKKGASCVGVAPFLW
jgi:hypothetical protein